MQILDNKKVYSGRIFNLYKTHLKENDGARILRETVVHPGTVVIIPFISMDKVILVRQYRYASGRHIRELPAGTLGPKETPLTCAKRELEKEIGFVAGRIKMIMEFYTCPGFCTEKMCLFKAEKLQVTAQKLDPDEKITYKTFNRSEIRHLVEKNKLTDAKSLIGLILWLQRKI